MKNKEDKSLNPDFLYNQKKTRQLISFDHAKIANKIYKETLDTYKNDLVIDKGNAKNFINNAKITRKIVVDLRDKINKAVDKLNLDRSATENLSEQVFDNLSKLKVKYIGMNLDENKMLIIEKLVKEINNYSCRIKEAIKANPIDFNYKGELRAANNKKYLISMKLRDIIDG